MDLAQKAKIQLAAKEKAVEEARKRHEEELF